MFTLEKNSGFTAFLDSNLHTRLAIVTANELGLAFPPKNLPKKFRPDPSTFYLVIVVTNKQTERQTYAGDYIISRESFRGDNKVIPFVTQKATLAAPGGPRSRARGMRIVSTQRTVQRQETSACLCYGPNRLYSVHACRATTRLHHVSLIKSYTPRCVDGVNARDRAARNDH